MQKQTAVYGLIKWHITDGMPLDKVQRAKMKTNSKVSLAKLQKFWDLYKLEAAEEEKEIY